uniref:Corticotropin releasing hormone b n=1 Tax=Oryzias latipes TaxID=8090 RepID=A0A3P9KZP9_ORYLA
MKLNLFGTTVILLVAFLPRFECRAIESPGGTLRVPAPQNSQQQQQSSPILERLGEEYFIRLGNGDSNSFPSSSLYPVGSPSIFNRALQLQRLLQGKVGNIRALLSGFGDRGEESMERGRRSEDPPISLDLTFHLLREMMEMSKAEQMAQQAQNNRRMMELFGWCKDGQTFRTPESSVFDRSPILRGATDKWKTMFENRHRPSIFYHRNCKMSNKN